MNTFEYHKRRWKFKWIFFYINVVQHTHQICSFVCLIWMMFLTVWNKYIEDLFESDWIHKNTFNFLSATSGCRVTFERYLPFEFKNMNEVLQRSVYHFIADCSKLRMVQLSIKAHAWVTDRLNIQTKSMSHSTTFTHIVIQSKVIRNRKKKKASLGWEGQFNICLIQKSCENLSQYWIDVIRT